MQEVFERCHIPYEVDKDMVWGLWFKYMCNVGENLTCALLGIPLRLWRSQAASSIRRAAMKEVQAVAEAKGIHISDEVMRGQDQTLLTILIRISPPPAGPGSREEDGDRDVRRKHGAYGTRAGGSHAGVLDVSSGDPCAGRKK